MGYLYGMSIPRAVEGIGGALADQPPPRRRVLAHRLVLLGLLAPIVALGVVFWLLLPGGAASASFSPGQFSRAAQLDPQTWAHREVSLRGYLAAWCSDRHGYPARNSRCRVSACGCWLLLDSPDTTPRPRRVPGGYPVPGPLLSTPPGTGNPLGVVYAVHLLPQGESGWHRLLRRIFPGLAEPFPVGHHPGDRITIAGTLDGSNAQSGTIAVLPKEL